MTTNTGRPAGRPDDMNEHDDHSNNNVRVVTAVTLTR
jgi:hypothetical protein